MTGTFYCNYRRKTPRMLYCNYKGTNYFYYNYKENMTRILNCNFKGKYD
jgi:hypothetical protein